MHAIGAVDGGDICKLVFFAGAGAIVWLVQSRRRAMTPLPQAQFDTFRVTRALRALRAGLPHYFLEATRQTDTATVVLHFAGLWLFQLEPQESRPRRFPTEALTIVDGDDENMGTPFRLVCEGEPVEPVMIAAEMPGEVVRRGWLTEGLDPVPATFDELLAGFYETGGDDVGLFSPPTSVEGHERPEPAS